MDGRSTWWRLGMNVVKGLQKGAGSTKIKFKILTTQVGNTCLGKRGGILESRDINYCYQSSTRISLGLDFKIQRDWPIRRDKSSEPLTPCHTKASMPRLRHQNIGQ
ncbi:hypothetical protein MGG_16307 [Pyricularia oryzae 70-15]|uniref:Uncharacterized protein n=1 Tax=Pyricularia oryzae (strain 70-15 / ATCC MYA-4617 / FGSC 8958) TaxID=242507 RepID=G4MS21_PYRO7|nr:uncharacterized protein MGG_16307 [Pyricularia oryzae 70-15]EHA57487.1 hypothetical protein MGG_16307 [Pyricularia oryzae 70-15]